MMKIVLLKKIIEENEYSVVLFILVEVFEEKLYVSFLI